MTLWVDGKFVEDGSPIIGAMDRGLLLGDGLFETIKVANRKPLFLTEHLCRLEVSAREIGLPIDRPWIRHGLNQLLERSHKEEIGSARVTVTRGGGPRGLSPIPTDRQKPHTFISLGKASIVPEQIKPDRLLIAPFVRSSGSPSARMKTLSYTDNLAAKAWADTQGSSDVIFLNERGDVTSTAMANLFVEAEGFYLTPPLSSGILPGIVREILMAEALEHRVPIKVKKLKPGDLWGRRILRTNSLLGVREAWLDHGRAPEILPFKDGGVLGELYRAAERREMGE